MLVRLALYACVDDCLDNHLASIRNHVVMLCARAIRKLWRGPVDVVVHGSGVVFFCFASGEGCVCHDGCSFGGSARQGAPLSDKACAPSRKSNSIVTKNAPFFARLAYFCRLCGNAVLFRILLSDLQKDIRYLFDKLGADKCCCFVVGCGCQALVNGDLRQNSIHANSPGASVNGIRSQLVRGANEVINSMLLSVGQAAVPPCVKILVDGSFQNKNGVIQGHPRRRGCGPWVCSQKSEQVKQSKRPLAVRVAGQYRDRCAVCPAHGDWRRRLYVGVARATRPVWARFSYGRARCEHLRVRRFQRTVRQSWRVRPPAMACGRSVLRWSSTMFAVPRESDRQKLERMRRAYGPRRRATCWTRQRCGRVTGQCPWQSEGGRA